MPKKDCVTGNAAGRSLKFDNRHSNDIVTVTTVGVVFDYFATTVCGFPLCVSCRFDTCCKGCIMGFGHDLTCKGFGGSALAGVVVYSKLPVIRGVYNLV